LKGENRKEGLHNENMGAIGKKKELGGKTLAPMLVWGRKSLPRGEEKSPGGNPGKGEVSSRGREEREILGLEGGIAVRGSKPKEKNHIRWGDVRVSPRLHGRRFKGPLKKGKVNGGKQRNWG